MADNKTKKTRADVIKFMDSIENSKKREDSVRILNLMKEISGEEPRMWGPSIIGFGNYHYKYKSGREGDFFLTGFSPRKSVLTLYIMGGFGRYKELLAKLGKYKHGKSCLYIKNFKDVEIDVLKNLISESVEYIKNKKWP
ncbi:MAG: DUF1801 domain-containing protein [Cytophagales bacterium]